MRIKIIILLLMITLMPKLVLSGFLSTTTIYTTNLSDYLQGGTLTDTKICTWDDTNNEIDCDYTDLTGGAGAGISAWRVSDTYISPNETTTGGINVINASNYFINGTDLINYLINQEFNTSIDLGDYLTSETDPDSLHLTQDNWGDDGWIDWVNPNFAFNQSKLAVTYYDATQAGIVAGTFDDSGGLNQTNHSDARYDGNTFNFTEEAGSPGLDLRINFTEIDSFSQGVMRYYTSSLAGDAPLIQMWNYDFGIWEDYPYITESIAFATITQPVFDSTEHIGTGSDLGIAQMRIYKASNGNINNHYFVDWIAIAKGFGVPSGQEVDPYSIHTDAINHSQFNYEDGQLNMNSTYKPLNSTHADTCSIYAESDPIFSAWDSSDLDIINTSMLDNGTLNRSIDLSDYLTSYTETDPTALKNNSPANITDLRVQTINGTDLALFNKSIDLSTYNYSVDLSGYISDASLYQIESVAWKLLNLTDYLGGKNFSTYNESLDLSNYYNKVEADTADDDTIVDTDLLSIVNLTMLDNNTVIRTHNTTWIDTFVQTMSWFNSFWKVANSTANYLAQLSLNITRGDLITPDNSSWIGTMMQNDTINRSIDLSTYNYSIDLSSYISDASSYQIEASAFKRINITDFFGVDNESIIKVENTTWAGWALQNDTINRSIDLSTYNYSIDLSGYATSYIRSCDYVVCASDADDTTNCDAVCDQSSDETEINTGIDDVTTNGGTVCLSGGTFIIDGSIVMKDYVQLQGSGRGTIIQIKASTNVGHAIGESATNGHITVKDLTIDGNSGNAGIGEGIYFTSAPYTFIMDLYIHDTNSGYVLTFGGSGVVLDDCDNSIMMNNWIDDCGTAILSTPRDSGMFVKNSDYCIIGNNILTANTLAGAMFDTCTFSSISGNVVLDSIGAGYWFENTDDSSITNNVAKGNALMGIRIYDGCEYNLVAMNTAQGNSQTGLSVEGDGHNTVSSNVITDNQNTGLGIASNHNTITSNSMLRNNLAGGAAYDGIALAGDHNFLSGNVVRADATTKTNYGLNVNTGINNTVIGNDFHDSGKKNVNDNGVDTYMFNNRGATATQEMNMVYMNNTDGDAMADGDIVILKAVADGDEVMHTTTQGDYKVFGMAVEPILNLEYGYIQTSGKTTKLKADGTANIAIGDYLTPSTTAGVVEKAASGDMAIAMALEIYETDDANGVIDALLFTPRLMP